MMTLAIAWFCLKVSDDDVNVISFFSFAGSLKNLRVGGLPWHSSASSAGCRYRRLHQRRQQVTQNQRRSKCVDLDHLLECLLIYRTVVL
jgi:hypothetical protein